MLFFIMLCGTCSAQENLLPGRSGEVIAYPFRNFNFINPQFDRVNKADGSYFNTYLTRVVVTTESKNHFRVDLPFASTNATADHSTVFGFSDMDLRYTRILGRGRNTFWGASAQIYLPTASNEALGSGICQLRTGLGGIYLFPRSRGSIFLSGEYRFSIHKEGKANVSVFAWSPNCDYWFKKGYVGYYATWTYDFRAGRLDIPLDVEAGYPVFKNIVASFEYILPLTSVGASYNNELTGKLRFYLK